MNHYVNNEGNVYSCLLDVSKAFDLFHYGKLFIILMSKQISKCVIRLILDSYIRKKSLCNIKFDKIPLF